jgi:hypothetical protein
MINSVVRVANNESRNFICGVQSTVKIQYRENVSINKTGSKERLRCKLVWETRIA